MGVFCRYRAGFLAAFPLTALLSACGGGGGGATATAADAASLAGLSVTPDDPTVRSGASIQLTAIRTSGDGSTSDLTDQVSWSSSNTAVATVNENGVVNAPGVGRTTITATDSSGLSASTDLGVQGFSIQGTIVVGPGSTADTDVNDMIPMRRIPPMTPPNRRPHCAIP